MHTILSRRSSPVAFHQFLSLLSFFPPTSCSVLSIDTKNTAVVVIHFSSQQTGVPHRSPRVKSTFMTLSVQFFFFYVLRHTSWHGWWFSKCRNKHNTHQLPCRFINSKVTLSKLFFLFFLGFNVWSKHNWLNYSNVRSGHCADYINSKIWRWLIRNLLMKNKRN